MVSDKQFWEWGHLITFPDGGLQHLVKLMLEQAFFLTLRKGPLSHHFYALILDPQPGTNYNKSILSSYHSSHQLEKTLAISNSLASDALNHNLAERQCPLHFYNVIARRRWTSRKRGGCTPHHPATLANFRTWDAWPHRSSLNIRVAAGNLSPKTYAESVRISVRILGSALRGSTEIKQGWKINRPT